MTPMKTATTALVIIATTAAHLLADLPRRAPGGYDRATRIYYGRAAMIDTRDYTVIPYDNRDYAPIPDPADIMLDIRSARRYTDTNQPPPHPSALSTLIPIAIPAAFGLLLSVLLMRPHDTV